MFDCAPLLACIRLLRQRHEDVAAERAEPELGRNLTTLRLAEAYLERAEAGARHPGLPLQLAVIGPTQAGKSTLVNLLLDRDAARVSPLAGYTVHPQGFAVAAGTAGRDWLHGYFHGYHRLALVELPRDDYRCYALEAVDAPDFEFPGTVVWDTPDFDSVTARDYADGVLRTVALADVVVLVTSKDKYADQAVWDTMKLIEPLNQPALLCLNKIDPETEPVLVRSLGEKWRENRGGALPPIVCLPYQRDREAGRAAGRDALISALRPLWPVPGRYDRQRVARDLARRHWDEWLAPVRLEHQAEASWNATVDAVLRDSVAVYRRDYLDHPQHYHTFHRALAELLVLLEVPGVGSAMALARRAVTWPFRQLGRLTRGGRRSELDGQEAAILAGIAGHALIRANETALLRCDEQAGLRFWWVELAAELRALRLAGLAGYAPACERYQREFTPQIEATARQLLERLREHPATLNGLRATRLTTDAAAVALALHSGGIGLQDFIIAPAMLALTSLMAEGVIGRYLRKAEQDLKQRQSETVEALLTAALAEPLRQLPRRMGGKARFGIAAAQLESAAVLLQP